MNGESALSFSLAEQVVYFLALVVSFSLFALAVGHKLKLVLKGAPENRFDRIGSRIWMFIVYVLGQKKVIGGRPLVGIAHAGVFWGFVVFLVGNLNNFARGFNVSLLGYGGLAQAVTQVLNVFAVIVLVGVISLAVRRYVLRPKYLTYPSVESAVIITLIAILMVTYLLFSVLGGTALKVNWWIHTLTVLVFLVYIPASKHLHLMVAPFNVFLKSWRLGELRKLDLEDFEKEDFGVNTLSDLTWRDLLDPFACILCGRCTEACPANVSGKDLEPRQLIQDLKSGMMAGDFAKPIVGNMVDSKVIWQCTTCGSCEYNCPTGNEHVRKVIGLRRYQVAESNFPPEAANVFRGLEKNFNPWNYGTHLRQEFLESAAIPLYEPGMEYLLFMGCFANYDQGYRPVVEAMLKVLRSAGVSFGVMENELCCGDPARRLGNEMVFQMLATENVENIKALDPPKILTLCPHCRWTLANDYRDFGLEVEVIHHSQLLPELIKQGRLKLGGQGAGSLVYHDPCYLSRYAGIIEEPRSVLRAAGYDVVEPGRTKDSSFCCGGGGGRLFLEETEGERINHLRVQELADSGKSFATACPYCRFMLRDGLADKGWSEKFSVMDLAEAVSERIVD